MLARPGGEKRRALILMKLIHSNIILIRFYHMSATIVISPIGSPPIKLDSFALESHWSHAEKI